MAIHDNDVTHSMMKFPRNVMLRTRLLRANMRNTFKYEGRTRGSPWR